MPFLRAYHFLPVRYALDDLRYRRLKIARFDDLNDPFELWDVALRDRHFRSRFKATKQAMARRFVMLCFSLSWHNPLLWSHYADKHHGIALGFDIKKTEGLKSVSYVKSRPVLTQIDSRVAVRLMTTKYIGWRYEQEVRIFIDLEVRHPVSGLYFYDLSEKVVLREVILGPLCTATNQELRDVLGTTADVTVRKGSLVLNSFRVVTDTQR